MSCPPSRDPWCAPLPADVSVVLEQAVDMPRGDYEVEITMSDLQGKGAVQVVTVKVCGCVGGQCVASSRSVGMGAWGVLALLLALAMLLLLCEWTESHTPCLRTIWTQLPASLQY